MNRRRLEHTFQYSLLLNKFWLLLLMKTSCSDIVGTIVYDKPKKLLAESWTMSFSLRRFVALSKIVQATYQSRSPQDKTAQITV